MQKTSKSRSYKFISELTVIVLFTNVLSALTIVKDKAIYSINTNYTISKVRTAINKNTSFIVGASYKGTMVAYSFQGELLWEHKLSGFMNHDMWCGDITGDGIDEILTANADGTIYCLNHKGKLLWAFKQNDAPMYAVCTIKKGNQVYVVAGGYDKHIYYLSSKGRLVKALHSSKYSKEKSVGNAKPAPRGYQHLTNFIRKVKQPDGSEVLVLQGVVHSMSKTARGSLYFFNPLEEVPFKVIKLVDGRPFGDLNVLDINKDGDFEIILGTTTNAPDAELLRVSVNNEKQERLRLKDLPKGNGGFGYKVLQTATFFNGKETQYFSLFGDKVVLIPSDFNPSKGRMLSSKYAYNDMWKDNQTGQILFASAQSGGSCIHIINPRNPSWETEYEMLEPVGKIASIIKNTNVIKEQLKAFKKPSQERAPLPVYFLSEKVSEKDKEATKVMDKIKRKYESPMFLESAKSDKEVWDRSAMPNEKYKTRRDRRMKYTQTQQQVVDNIVSSFDNASGISYWGGHGNDPYMYQLSTNKKIVSDGNKRGKHTVMIFPELEDHTKDFEFVMEDYFYPLAKHSQGKNGKIYVRTKHTFWQANVYLPMWNRLLSGEFADVFIPAMEETTDKSMELSLAARQGIWASGATNSWGARCARDNASFDRLRQHSHQMLPSHFLRTMVYSISSGAQYMHNFPVNQDYMSLLWDLIAKGALYVPKRSEILSYSPVHLSMTEPDELYINESNNTKWTTFFDEALENNNPRVFSRLNGTWPGAPVTDWDFSRYAAGVNERRLNFIPEYTNGLVLITPPQKGIFAQQNTVRKSLKDNLHPYYKNILTEFITDGRDYISADGGKKFAANDYYKVVEKAIRDKAKLLPITVSGNVGWVVAQSSPKHLRLTLVENGYINPDNATAHIKFNTISPVKIKDILSNEVFEIDADNTTKIEIPLGGFKFIDIELTEPLIKE